MIGNLASALINLLTTSLPGLIGNGAEQVVPTVLRPDYDIDPSSADALAGAPRPDDASDSLAFDEENPAGPYLLSRPPYPGPRRVYLENASGERLALSNEEVLWDSVNPQQFSLQIKAHRVITGLDQLTVLYGVTAIFSKIKSINRVQIQLSGSNAANLAAAEVLALGLLQLNRDALKQAAEQSVSDGDYTAITRIEKLVISRGLQSATDTATIELRVESEVKASRALAENEGVAIERIASSSAAPDPNHPVQIDPIVEA